MHIETMIHQKLLVDDNYKQKTAKKRKFTVQSTCFDTIMSEKSRVSGKSSNFRILGQFFRVGTQKYSFPWNTATILKLSLLWTRSTPLTLPLLSWYVMTFCVFVRSLTCWLCFVAPIPRGLQSLALLAPNFRQLRRTCECHI